VHRSPYCLILLQTEAFIRPEFFYPVIISFCGLILVFLTVMLIILLRKNWITIRQKYLQLQYKDWLVGIILEEADAPQQAFAVPAKIGVLLQQSFSRQQLLQELKQLKSSLSGKPAENLEKLYRQLGLAAISARSLRSRRWYCKAKGIQELAVMNQKDFAPEIYPLTQHPHPVVRMEAQIAMVCLQQYQGLRFFESLVYPLTEWHQVKLLQIMSSQALPPKEVIARWLQSPNASVVQFTIKLIGEQHALTFEQEVIACLSHPQETVRRQAIACLGDLPSAPAAKALRDLFSRETNKDLQIGILAGLTHSGATNDLPFLEELLKDQDADIRLEAEKTLLHLQSQVIA
jgi:hypothetical protein